MTVAELKYLFGVAETVFKSSRSNSTLLNRKIFLGKVNPAAPPAMKARHDAKKEVNRLREEEAENLRLRRQLKKLVKAKLESAGITTSSLNLPSQMPSVPPEKYRLHYGLPNVNDIHPEVKKYLEDNPITLDHLTKPKFATALPVPQDLIEKYRLYEQKKLLPDQSNPPPKEPAVSAKSTTSTGDDWSLGDQRSRDLLDPEKWAKRILSSLAPSTHSRTVSFSATDSTKADNVKEVRKELIKY